MNKEYQQKKTLETIYSRYRSTSDLLVAYVEVSPSAPDEEAPASLRARSELTASLAELVRLLEPTLRDTDMWDGYHIATVTRQVESQRRDTVAEQEEVDINGFRDFATFLGGVETYQVDRNEGLAKPPDGEWVTKPLPIDALRRAHRLLTRHMHDIGILDAGEGEQKISAAV
jgi:hypothetical protein